jgi:hypothetical protein
MLIHAGNHPTHWKGWARGISKSLHLMAPLASSEQGCKPSVYRVFRTLTPLN